MFTSKEKLTLEKKVNFKSYMQFLELRIHDFSQIALEIRGYRTDCCENVSNKFHREW